MSERKDIYDTDYDLLKNEKTAIQKAMEDIEQHDVLEMPEFIINPNLEDERKVAFEKIRYLLKRRYSLITIADVLQTNNYANLDDIINKRNQTYKAIETYTNQNSQEGQNPFKFLNGFKKMVGDENAKLYAEQEKRVIAAINILYDGTYFESAKKKDEGVALYVEDVIANVIDTPDFNFACKIESEFIMEQLKKATEKLSLLRSRQELEDLVEQLNKISEEIEKRHYAYDVMNKLLTGNGIAIEFEIKEDGEGER